MSTGKRKASSSALTSLFASYGSDSDDEDGEIKEEGAGEGEEEENENHEEEDTTLALGAYTSGRSLVFQDFVFLMLCLQGVIRCLLSPYRTRYITSAHRSRKFSPAPFPVLFMFAWYLFNRRNL